MAEFSNNLKTVFKVKMPHATMNEDISKQKQFSSCAFLASTPAVSPSQRLISSAAGNNNNRAPSNVNLPINEQSFFSTNINLTVCQQQQQHNMQQFSQSRDPGTGTGTGTNDLPLLSDGCFSPIDRMGGDNLIHTMNFSVNETVMGISRIKSESGGMESKKPQTPYPFPTPNCMKNFRSWNKYETLLETLSILKCFSSFDTDTATGSSSSSSTAPERKDPTNSSRGNKRVEVVKPKEKPEFVFTKEMFMSNNSEAFIQVTHFLFHLFDKAETLNRFRDSWPIYERKQEAIYRRKALEWFKEIISDNPVFFSKSVRLEQLQGLIVNPFGERFIRFIHSFADFVMFKATQSDELAEDPILQKPVFVRKPEISKRQGLILGARITKLAKQARSEQEKCIQENLMSKMTFEKMQLIHEESQSALSVKHGAVSKLIKGNLKYFPENANELLANQADFFRNTFRKIAFGDLWVAMEKIESPLNEYVSKVWRNALDSFGNKVDTVLDFVSRYSRLWLFLKASTQKSTQPELTNLYLPWEFRQTEQKPSINCVLKSYATIVNDCLKKLDILPISQEFLSQKKFLDSKLDMVRQKCEDISKIESPNVAALKAHLDFEIKALSIQLENVNWSKLSNLEDPPLSSMFDFSPARVVDARKKTGFTPALSSYLPAADERSFREADKNSWVHHQANNIQLGTESGPGLKKQFIPSNEKSIENPLFGTYTKGQDTCDSPISHLPPKSSLGLDRSLMLQNRNVNRRRSSNKCRLSLPIAEDAEPPEDSENPAPSPNFNDNPQDDGDGTHMTTQNGSTIEERLSALLQSFTTDLQLQQSASTPVVSRRSSRRSSANFSMKDKSNEISNNAGQFKLTEDLEEKLGILDITLSYANFLDLSQESEESGDELELNEF